MTDRPIIFSAPMVRALLAGRKTQTRRLASSPLAKVQPGDRIWVREAHALSANPDLKPWYRLDHPEAKAAGPRVDVKWRTSIHMPRWASRITLHVEAVRVERLQDISEADAEAEGVTPATEPPTAAALMTAVGRGAVFMPHRSAFANLWNSLHGPDAWDANPEVVVLQFRAARKPDHG